MVPSKVVFFGLFGQENLGNDVTLDTVLRHTRHRFPTAEIQCVCTGPQEIHQRYGIVTFPMAVSSTSAARRAVRRMLHQFLVRVPQELRHWAQAFHFLKGADMLMAPGTGLLVDDPTSPFRYPYYLFKWSLIARLRGCRVSFVSVGAGPIYHSLSRFFIRTALRLAEYRSYRDGFSKQYIRGIGLDTASDDVYPDLVFSMPRPAPTECRNGEPRRPVVGVGVMDYCGQGGVHRRKGEAVYRDYLHQTMTFLLWLLEHGFDVRLLIGDTLYDNSAKRDLLNLVHQQRRAFGHDGTIVDEPIASVDDLLAQMACCDVVVSPRFHNILLALILNKPAVSISYNEKADSLMGDVGLAEYCQSIDRLDVARLIEQFVSIRSRADSLLPSVARRTDEYRRKLDEQYARVFEPSKQSARRAVIQQKC